MRLWGFDGASVGVVCLVDMFLFLRPHSFLLLECWLEVKFTVSIDFRVLGQPKRDMMIAAKLLI